MSRVQGLVRVAGPRAGAALACGVLAALVACTPRCAALAVRWGEVCWSWLSRI